jgi:DNA primase
MRFGEGLRDEILRRTDLVALVGWRVKLARKGRVFWGLCPFHKEKSPSFKVENERRHYHCFGCGAGGDAFTWLMETEGLSFPEAVEKLAGEAGVQLPAWSAQDEEREKKRKSLYEVIALAASFFEEQLGGRGGTSARTYLKTRGLREETVRKFRLGYAPDGDRLIAHLESHGVAVSDMVEAGLARAGDGEMQARDFFFDRLMFPIADSRGRIVAFGGRGLSPDAKPKYINTGETALFSKGRLLYNFGPAREAALKGAPLIVAEGYLDVIALVEAGFAGAVAPLGTALTEDQLGLIWRVAPEPILCFDGDEAGLRAGARASHLALPHLIPGQSLRFGFLPKGEDPDSFLRSHGPGPMRALIEKAEPLAGVLWAGETEDRDFSTPERRAGLEAALEALVRTIRDPKVADYYRQDFRARVFDAFRPLRIGAGGRWRGRRGAPGKDGRGGRAAPEPVSTAVKQSSIAVSERAGRDLSEKRYVALLLETPEFIHHEAEVLAEMSFGDSALDRLRRELLNLAASGTRLDNSAVEAHLVRQGIGALAERLTKHSVLKIDLKERTDRAAREALLLRMREQLADPDGSGTGGLKAQRDRVLQLYLDSGAKADWDELQRLNGELRQGRGV